MPTPKARDHPPKSSRPRPGLPVWMLYLLMGQGPPPPSPKDQPR